ncbi:hypothetical protein FQA39_LY18192 [Lamprigera yunnana]|nr:hypothetical protein FQA39_LY18192 [Lamprigera yunnana]
MHNLVTKLRASFNRRFFKVGIPFFVLVIGGSFYLEQFTKLKFRFGKQQSLIHPDALKKEGIVVKSREEVTLEAQYEKMKKLNLDNWEQIRIPRPWDEEAED